ncbi:DUF3857 domain-containing protein [Ekhidna sp.]|uniref:DUF3857 domain-containing protein n=1 Tax=Ekhidna sp. TaxID=2608089 RepID=UPI003299CEBA
MKSFILSNVLIACVLVPAFSQDYSVDKISAELKDGVDAVTRHHSGEFEILSINKAKFKMRRVITIFNKDGNHNALLSVFYDDLRNVNDLQAFKYDSNGDRIEKVKKADFIDESAVSGSTFFDDSRVLWYDLRQDQYPYTVEYEYEVTYKFLYSIPDWHFIDAYDESVEYSTYSVKSPESLTPRYKTLNAKNPEITLENGSSTATWTEKNVVAIPFEPYSSPLSDVAPKVILSPAVFEFEGYQGDMSTWDGIAKWQNTLNEGREELSAETVNKIKELTSGMSDSEKIKTIYEYVQENTRYVSLQLGIGGFQPFPAKFVDEEGYGDCKALSFYTQSLLRSVGVTSHYTWVSAGNNPPSVDPDFPNDTFNHIILCVPNKGDTIWLECTSQIMPFGFLGDFTSDRDVFVVTENGGQIVRTPSYDLNDNFQQINSEVELFEDGNAKIKSNVTYSGLRYDALLGVLNSGKENQEKWLERNIKISSFILEEFSFQNNKNKMPQANLETYMVARNLTSKSGTRFFLQPNLMNKNTFIPNKDSDRRRNININYEVSETDSIFYTLPENHAVEAFFEPVEIRSQFGTYKAELSQLEDGRILYYRSFTQNKGQYEPSNYQEFTDFHKRIVRADKKRISFKKKT